MTKRLNLTVLHSVIWGLTEKHFVISICCDSIGFARHRRRITWTDTTRKPIARSGPRVPSDLTDAEWAVLGPLFPARSHRGRPPVWRYRQIVEALLYLLRGSLLWRMPPPDLFPPMTSVQHLLLPLARHGVVVLDQSHALDGGVRGDGAGGLAICPGNRQPKRQNHGQRRPVRL